METDSWRANVNQVIEKLGEEESTDGKRKASVSSSCETRDKSETDVGISSSSDNLKNTKIISGSSVTSITTTASGVPSTTIITSVSNGGITSTSTDLSSITSNIASSRSTLGPAGGDDELPSTNSRAASPGHSASPGRGTSPARSLGPDLKVPPLKIILHGVSSDTKTRVHENPHAAKQALPYVVVKADAEGCNGSNEAQDSNSSVDAVTSSTPGLGDREGTASPTFSKKDDKEGAKSRGSSREKDGDNSGEVSEGRRMTRRAAAAAAATGTESSVSIADSSGFIDDNGEKQLPQPPRKRRMKVCRTNAPGSHTGSDFGNPGDGRMKLDKEHNTSTNLTLPISQPSGGSNSSHSGNGVDSTSVNGIPAQDNAAPDSATNATTQVNVVTSVAGKEEPTVTVSDRRSHLYKPRMNCIERYLKIKKQIDTRRQAQADDSNSLEYKLPPEFKDLMISKKNYILAGNHASRFSIPMLTPPQSVTGRMRELFIEQEKERYRLRLRHHIEREKLVLAIEPEILRCYTRAARSSASHQVPLSACSVLKDEEIYNPLNPAQMGETSPQENNGDSKLDIKGRSRYNGRHFLSWKQEVVEKFDKNKEALILRHHHEAESLHAVQKMDWEFKMRECGFRPDLGFPTSQNDINGCIKYCAIDEVHVPMVQVNDDFELLPS